MGLSPIVLGHQHRIKLVTQTPARQAIGRRANEASDVAPLTRDDLARLLPQAHELDAPRRSHHEERPIIAFGDKSWEGLAGLLERLERLERLENQE